MTQSEIRKLGPDPTVKLIQDGEILRIRQLWLHEEGNWENSVPAIYREIIGKEYPLIPEDSVSFNIEDHQLLEKLCENKMEADLVARLIDLERSMEGMNRRAGVINKIDKIFNEEWRTEEELQEEITKSLEAKNAH